MPRIYGYVRPYPGRLGRQVRDFVEDQGFVLGPGMVVAAGATDTYASRWIMRATMDLLVLPFHLHRGDGGRVLDAIGVLMSLPEDVDLGGLTVLMPVRAFSWGSSFQRRMELLRETRPHIAGQLLVAHQDEIGSASLAARLRRAYARPPSTAPLVRSPSMAPPTVRDLPPHAPIDYDDLISIGASDAESAHFEITREPTASGMQLTRRRTDPPAHSQERARTIQSDGVSGTTAPPSSGSERSSRIQPTGETTPESARESFRRAAEIGARVRKEIQDRKKGK